MNHCRLVHFAASAGIAAAALAQGQVAGQLEPEQRIVAEALVDTDGNGRAELVLVDASGGLHRHGFQTGPASTGGWRPRGSIALRDPTHSLLCFADLLPEPGTELVVADGSGTAIWRWPEADGNSNATMPLLRRARCLLRTDQPQLRPFVQDLNRDGRLDVLLPGPTGVQPFLQEAPAADGNLQFRALPPLLVRADIDAVASDGSMDDEHRGNLVVPQIETIDLNGDGRPDLVTRQGMRHRFHLQGDDGIFREPIEIDIKTLEDSTPKAAVAPGATIVLGDRQQLQRGDIDGDGIPDFVVAHRRKIWTFVSSSAGPQFNKARTQAVAEDVSAMLLVDLDDDRRADLLTFQVQLPGVGTLLLGMVQSTDIDIKAVGYRSEESGFANTPTWRRTITLRIPSLLSLLNRQEELVQRFVDLVSKVRPRVRGAFRDPDENALAIVSGDGKTLDLHGAPIESTNDRKLASRELRRTLFEDNNPLFDLERMFSLVASFLDGSGALLRDDQKPVASLALRTPERWQLLRLVAAELDGQPGLEIVAIYTARDDEQQRAYDVLRFAADHGN